MLTVCSAGIELLWEAFVKKTEVLDLLNAEPEDLDIDKFIYTLWFRSKLERALAEADAGCEVSLEEIDQMIDEWPE